MVEFDWHDSRHWNPDDQLCRYCREPTHLRDPKNRPAHKVCAQDAHEKRLRREAARRRKDHL